MFKIFVTSAYLISGIALRGLAIAMKKKLR
jgi:hypothetical protein